MSATKGSKDVRKSWALWCCC